MHTYHIKGNVLSLNRGSLVLSSQQPNEIITFYTQGEEAEGGKQKGMQLGSHSAESKFQVVWPQTLTLHHSLSDFATLPLST